MKKIALTIALVLATVLSAMAQPGYGGPYSRNRGHGYGYGYGRDRGRIHYYDNNFYGGIKVGLVASHVSSNSEYLDANRLETGLSAGFAAGFNISPFASLESGLYYVEKGGSSNSNGRFTYELDYLEVPFLIKYNYYSPNNFVVQPYLGFYVGFGVGGMIRDFQNREAFSSYSDGYFRHGDSGFKIGCGFTYSFLYFGVGYDLGLSNIGQDFFDDTRNRALRLNVGFAF